MKQKLLIASGNPGKIKEIREILSPLGFSLTTPQEEGLVVIVKETGHTYAENARLKAEGFLKVAKMPVLSDDSGLEVEALGGAPGVYSARFSPKENASDADRRQHLLAQLGGKPQPWKAEFRCTAILALPDQRKYMTTGQCEGVIIPEERGTTGFGYDPVFYLSKHNATMAELGPAIKNQISHRARALQNMRPILELVFNQ